MNTFELSAITVLAACTVLAAQNRPERRAATAATAASPAKQAYHPPMTPWGDPDLQATWTSDNSIGVPFERPPQYGNRAVLTDEEFAKRDEANVEQIAKDNSEEPEAPFEKDAAANNAPRHWLERAAKPSHQTSLVIDPPNGRIPELTAEGQRRRAERFALRRVRGPADGPEDQSLYDRCITRGVTGSILPAIYGNGTQIVQGPGYVVIRNEMVHENRLIPLAGGPHVGPAIHMYMGDSRGHFEGNTLVVETTNFTDKTGIGGGAMNSESLKLTERFTRTAPDTLRYEFTVDDPVIYTAQWTVGLDLNTKPGYEIYEYACHEGNYGMRNMLSAARAEEREAAARK